MYVEYKIKWVISYPNGYIRYTACLNKAELGRIETGPSSIFGEECNVHCYFDASVSGTKTLEGAKRALKRRFNKFLNDAKLCPEPTTVRGKLCY